jgi:hypothetical protein
VDRVVERLVHVNVPFPVQVPFEVRVPYEVRVPFPIYLPMHPSGPTSVQNVQLNALFAGMSPSGFPVGRTVPSIDSTHRLLLEDRRPLAIEGADYPMLLGSPPPPPVAASATDSVTAEDDEEDTKSQSSAKKRKYTVLDEWPAEWRAKYEEWKTAMKDLRQPGRGQAMFESWDEDLQHQVRASCGPHRQEVIQRWQEAKKSQGGADSTTNLERPVA